MGNLKNFATGTVLVAPSPATSGTSLQVQSGEGAAFPAAPFYATVWPDNTLPTLANAEVVLVTAKSTDTFTITRAQKEPTAKSIAVNWRISNAIFAEDLMNGSMVYNEVPGGSVNGSNTAFTIAGAGKVTGSLAVYKNGVRMKNGGADFTETSGGFTMTTAPAANTVLLCEYRVGSTSDYSVGSNSIISDETPTGSVNGSNTTFTTARAFIAGTLEVYINGLKLARTAHYTETTPGTGSFTISDAPLTGDVVRVNYQYNLNPSSNADTVDGIHANTIATANNLMPLDSNAKIPATLLTNPYKFSAYRSSTATLTTNVNTKIAFQAELFDTGNNYDSTTNFRFTAPIAGFYRFGWAVDIAGGSGAVILTILYKNGSEYKRGSRGILPSAGALNSSGSGLVQLAQGDYVELWGYGSTGTIQTGATAETAWFDGEFVSAT